MEKLFSFLYFQVIYEWIFTADHFQAFFISKSSNDD